MRVTHALSDSVNKVLIVCPVTLVANWKKEFRKWQVLAENNPIVSDTQGRS
jgi:SNF2 family DNA or RNA helicase